MTSENFTVVCIYTALFLLATLMAYAVEGGDPPSYM